MRAALAVLAYAIALAVAYIGAIHADDLSIAIGAGACVGMAPVLPLVFGIRPTR